MIAGYAYPPQPQVRPTKIQVAPTQTKVWSTVLIDAIVKSPRHMSIQAKTVKNFDLSAEGAFIGVWQGSHFPSMKSFVATTQLHGISDGHFHPVALEINKPGSDFINDAFTIGLFLKYGDVGSLSATANIMKGKTICYRRTSLLVRRIFQKSLYLQYSVPSFIRPKTRHDAIYLLRNGEPVPTSEEYLSDKRVPSDATFETVRLEMPGKQFGPGKYTLQYNPGNFFSTVAAANTFYID